MPRCTLLLDQKHGLRDFRTDSQEALVLFELFFANFQLLLAILTMLCSFVGVKLLVAHSADDHGHCLAALLVELFAPQLGLGLETI